MEGIIPEYTDFVKQVLARDNYTCQCCGQEHGELNVHHLNGYRWFKEGRTDPNNGITLCENCHMNFHYEYGKKKNTKEQFEEWIGYTIKILDTYNHPLPIARKIYCIEEDKIYDSALVLEKEWNTFHTLIYAVCNRKQYTVCNKHLLWLDEYLQMTENDVKRYLENCIPKHYKKVICITTGKIFKTSKDARCYYNCSNHIVDCCKEKRNYCGTLPNGTKLQWMYYEDYIKQKDLENTDELCMENIT